MSRKVWNVAVVLGLLSAGCSLAGVTGSEEAKKHPGKVEASAAGKKDDRPGVRERQLETLRGKASDKRRLQAARTLGTMAAAGDREAMAGLLTVLADQDGGLNRVFAAIGLRNSKSVEAVEPLIGIVRDRALPSPLRKEAALTLGHLGDARAIPILQEAVDDPSSAEVRYGAYAGLHLFRSQVPQTPILLKILKDREQPPLRRARAAQFLAVMGDETAVEPLIELLLREPQSPVLTPEKSEDMTGQFFGSIMSSQRNVRAKIAVALGVLGDGRAVTPLLQVLNGSTNDNDTVQSSQNALEKIETRVGLAPFLSALKDPDPSIRLQAVLFLERLERPETEAPLEEALRDEKAEVREKAAAALARLREHRSTPAADEANKEEKKHDETVPQTN